MSLDMMINIHVTKIRQYVFENEIENIFIDMDGTICEFSHDDKVNVNDWWEKGLFENRRGLKTILYIIEKTFLDDIYNIKNIYILSSSPHSQANDEKTKWLYKNINAKYHDRLKIIYVGNAEYKTQAMDAKVKEIAKENEETFKCVKEKTLLIDDTHKLLFNAEKEGYNAWHISRLIP